MHSSTGLGGGGDIQFRERVVAMDASEDWVDVNTCLQGRDIFTCDHVTEGG